MIASEVNEFNGTEYMKCSYKNANSEYPLPFTSEQLAAGEFAPENIVMFARIDELKSSFCPILSHCFSIYELSIKSDLRLNPFSPRLNKTGDPH